MGIPDDVAALLQHSIRSVRQLDLLLLMRETGSEREWTVTELNAVLRASEDAIEAELYALLAAGLVDAVQGPPTRWRYRPGRSGATVDSLARVWKTHRTAVIRHVIASPSGSLSEFADAFRIRGRHTDG